MTMRIIQLLNTHNENVDLYSTNRDDLDQIHKDFDECLKLAEGDQNEADELLSERGIDRVFVDEVTTELL